MRLVYVLCLEIVGIQIISRSVLSVEQTFSTLALLIFWVRKFFVLGAILCIVGCLTVALASAHWRPVATPLPKFDNQMCLWGQKSPLVDNHRFRAIDIGLSIQIRAMLRSNHLDEFLPRLYTNTKHQQKKPKPDSHINNLFSKISLWVRLNQTETSLIHFRCM